MVEWILQIFNVKNFYLSRENKPKKPQLPMYYCTVHIYACSSKHNHPPLPECPNRIDITAI